MFNSPNSLVAVRQSPGGVDAVGEPPLAVRLAQLHEPDAPSRARIWLVFALSVLCWANLAGVILAWLLIRFAGDRWWLATVLMFGPRWIWAAPLFLLVPAALLARRRLLLPLGLAAVWVIWGLMGLCLPWPSAGSTDASPLRVLACNVHGGASGQAALRTLLDRVQPDVVALQECGDWDHAVFQQVFPADIWHVEQAGEFALASAYRIVRTETLAAPGSAGSPPAVRALYCVLDTPAGPVGLCTLHFSSPRQGLKAVLDRRTLLVPSRRGAVDAEIAKRVAESAAVSRWLAGRPEPLVIAGDFNMPTDSAIYRRYWSGWGNAFSQAGWGFGATKITNVGGVLYGLRIDHVLLDDTLRASRAWVADSIGSDHLPLVAEVGRRAEGRGQRAEGGGQRAEGRGQRAEGRGQRAEGRGRRAEGRGRRSVSENGDWLRSGRSVPVPLFARHHFCPSFSCASSFCLLSVRVPRAHLIRAAGRRCWQEDWGKK